MNDIGVEGLRNDYHITRHGHLFAQKCAAKQPLHTLQKHNEA